MIQMTISRCFRRWADDSRWLDVVWCQSERDIIRTRTQTEAWTSLPTKLRSRGWEIACLTVCRWLADDLDDDLPMILDDLDVVWCRSSVTHRTDTDRHQTHEHRFGKGSYTIAPKGAKTVRKKVFGWKNTNGYHGGTIPPPRQAYPGSKELGEFLK